MKWEEIIPILVAVVAVIIAMLTYSRKSYSARDQYDERQVMLRKNAYKYSAMTMLLAAIVYYIIVLVAGKPFAEDGVSVVLIAMLGVAVFAIYSIFKDAFFGIKGKRTGTGNPSVYILMLVVIIITNSYGAFRMVSEHLIVKDGVLTHNVMSLALAILFLLILVAIGIKYMVDRSVSEED